MARRFGRTTGWRCRTPWKLSRLPLLCRRLAPSYTLSLRSAHRCALGGGSRRNGWCRAVVALVVQRAAAARHLLQAIGLMPCNRKDDRVGSSTPLTDLFGSRVVVTVGSPMHDGIRRQGVPCVRHATPLFVLFGVPCRDHACMVRDPLTLLDSYFGMRAAM